MANHCHCLCSFCLSTNIEKHTGSELLQKCKKLLIDGHQPTSGKYQLTACKECSIFWGGSNRIGSCGIIELRTGLNSETVI